MQDQKSLDLQIVIASGPMEPRRAVLGFAMALATASSGENVRIFLAMDGVAWALRTEGNGPEADAFLTVSEHIEMILAEGGQIEVCSTCVGQHCAAGCGGKDVEALRPGLTVGGLAAVALSMAHIPTVVF